LFLDRNPLNLIAGNLFLPPVVKLCGARRGVVSHGLSVFELAAVLEIGGDARCAEGVIADLSFDAGRSGAALDHAVGVLLPHGVVGERAGLAGRRAE
jgi:hypothetical protein